MPTYVYGCSNKTHDRIEVVHRVNDEPVIECWECGEVMHRIPQVFRHYNDPRNTLMQFMDKKYTDWRIRRKKGIIRG